MFTAESGWTTFACGFRLVQGKRAKSTSHSDLDRVSSGDVLRRLGGKLATLLVPKYTIGWELEQLEEAAQLMVSKDSDSDDEST